MVPVMTFSYFAPADIGFFIVAGYIFYYVILLIIKLERSTDIDTHYLKLVEKYSK